MGIFFNNSTGDERIHINTNVSPITTTPFSVVMWVRPQGVASNAAFFFALSDTSADDNYWALKYTAANDWAIVANDGAGETAATTSITPGMGSEGQWHIVIGRFLSATNRRLHVIFPDGQIESEQGVSSRTPTGVETMSLGVARRTGSGHSGDNTIEDDFYGTIAEFWLVDGDVFASGGGGLPTENEIRALIYNGPFQSHYVRSRLVDYRSFRAGIITNHLNENYSGRYSKIEWGPLNSPILVDHPSIPYWYEKPNQTKIILPV